MIAYKNGNATVEIKKDGSRIIEYENHLSLDYPLNIDIRVTNKCSFGYNPKTGKAFCSFCHESARTDGKEANYNLLQQKLSDLPKGIELAIGGNEITNDLIDFLKWAKNKGFICNLTINQGHLKRDLEKIIHLTENEIVYGLGISYRPSLKWNVPEYILNYKHTVFHVIAGIDCINDVLSLSDLGVKKILILGEKDFGFNKGKVDLTTKKHKLWYYWVAKTFETFDVVSFDNLAVEQLNIKRFFVDNFDQFNQEEHSMYVNAVDQYYAESSRSEVNTSWNDISLKNFFKEKEKNVAFV